MCSLIVCLLLTLTLTLNLLAVSARGLSQEHAPAFLVEPPVRLVFSSRLGARVTCAAHGLPQPLVTWQLADGSTADDVPGLRVVLKNGTLVFPPFPAEQYRASVHAAKYRCRAYNVLGTLLSRDMRAHAVVWSEWEVLVSVASATAGSLLVLACSVPPAVREHAAPASWYRDGAALPKSDHRAGPILLVDDGWKLVIRSVKTEDAKSQFACSVLDSLTGQRRRSAPITIDVKGGTDPSPPRAVLPGVWGARALRGGDVVLPCLVHADPQPTITWYRESASGSLREVRGAEGAGRYVVEEEILLVRHVETGDAGHWACRATNAIGHTTVRVRLDVHAPLIVHLQPQKQVVNSGGTASMNCSWSGWPAPRLEWLHDGAPLGSGLGAAAGRARVLGDGEWLDISDVQRTDSGVYQCLARNDRDSAQASAELQLGNTAPELQYTFIEQVLRPGQVVTLKCSASGSPTPHFTWLLDAQPLNTMARGHRYGLEQFSTKTNEVVSYLNISAVRSEDGGLYSCRAANSLGEVLHTSRLNIYGPPYVRSIGPVRAIAGRELVLYCPYSGYPISSVKWEREGNPVEWDSNSDGGLRVLKVEPSHAGAYTCVVTGPHGGIARRELQLVVSNPPEIEPFSFSTNVQEGKRAQVSCSVSSGDMPVHFAWLRDGAPISSDLQVEERGADFFSNLVFKEVSARHSGLYTCVASNSAAKVNYTAELVVKVSPKWVREPSDAAVLAGDPAALHCDTEGSPPPHVTWLKQRGTGSDYIPLMNLGGRVEFLLNGTLWIESALPYDEGNYMCKAENGVGAPVTKIIFLAVNEPARFEVSAHNVSARRDQPAALTCDARGDHPLRVHWSHNTKHLDLNTYRLSVSEAKTESGLRSQLHIGRTDRHDSGVYKCQAVNEFGHSDHYIYLSVQERPEAPQALSVTELKSRVVRLTWTQGFDGNAPLQGFSVQRAPLAPHGLQADQWDTATTDNISLHDHDSTHSHLTLSKKGLEQYEVWLGGLQPHTAYMIRVAAINQIERSLFTEPVVVKTQEEAPSEPPSSVQVSAGGPGELIVSWRAPARDSWNGELLGYTIGCTELGTTAAERNSSRTLTVNGWASTEVTVTALRTFTRYEVRVRVFNGVAAGPASPPLVAATLEGVPESHPTRVSCSSLSSSSLKVSWAPPPPEHHGGLIQGYKVIYSPLTLDPGEAGEAGEAEEVGEAKEVGEAGESRRVTTTDIYLHALRKFTNYSVQVAAFTSAGDGRRSPSVYCLTEEDVPSAPQKIKALPYTSDSVLVSWLPPLYPNGIITHYTVYCREAGRLGKHLSFLVAVDKKLELEYMYQVRALQESQLYELWVSASTARGEGDATPVVGQGPNVRTGARIASFGGRVSVAAGAALTLPCACTGAPAPRSRWSHASQPVTHHAHYQVTPRGHLHIREVNEQSSGNFTCTATNALGEDAITYVVRALRVPAAPTLAVQYTTATGARLHWRAPQNGGTPIQGYLLHYKLATETEWYSVDLSPEANSYTMNMLKCGSTYNAKIQARNKISIGPPSEVLTVATRGSRPKAPKPEEHVHANSTAIKVNFHLWRDGGCPILGFHVSYRRAEAEHWIKVGDSFNSASVILSELNPATWYEVCVEAQNEAGAERATLLVDTRTASGARIAPLKPLAPLVGPVRGYLRTVFVSCAAGALALAVTLLAITCVLHGKNKFFCISSDHYVRDNRKLSESNEVEREKLREGQKLYSSTSINGNEKSNDNSSAELYEISPYATFGANIPGAPALQLRTLPRREDDAAPPRHHRHRACDHYRYDESSLSKCSTVEARHRLRAAYAGVGGVVENSGAWRAPPSDSDDNSESANTTIKGLAGSPGGSAYDSGRRGARTTSR